VKVIIDVHDATAKGMRGIKTYIINLVRNLMIRNNNDYGLSYFDMNHERGNQELILKYFEDLAPKFYACSNMKRTFSNYFNAYANRSYDDFIETTANVFHFPAAAWVPDKLDGAMVVTCHDTIPLIQEFEPVNRAAYTNYTIGMYRIQKMKPIIITDSLSTRTDVLSLGVVPEENVFAINLGVDTTQYKQIVRSDALQRFNLDKPYFVVVGSIGEVRKNTERIISAFNRLSSNYDINLVFLGRANSQFLNKFTENALIGEKIFFTDFVTEEDKISLIAGAEALLFPSLYEGFGLPIIEAQACGIPVITSNVSSMPEVAGDAAILIDPYNIEQLAFEMERVLVDSQLRADFITKGYENIKRFSWDKCATETEEVYKIAYERYNS